MDNVDSYVASLNERAEFKVEWQKAIKLYIRSAEIVFKQVHQSCPTWLVYLVGVCIP